MNTSNIPNTGFSFTNNQSIDDRRYVKFNEAAEFAFSLFAIRQLLNGSTPDYNDDPTNQAHRQVFRRLSLYALDAANVAELNVGVEKAKQSTVYVPLTRFEVQVLRRWLEARMLECEEQRAKENEALKVWSKQHTDAANSYGEQGYNGHDSLARADEEYPKPTQQFNPDTYIGQKFLLLDLREWLAGEVIQ